MDPTAKRPPEPGRPALWAWTAWVAAIIATGVCTVFAQVDAASIRHPGLAPVVPMPFSRYALQVRATEAIARRDASDGYPAAIALLKRSPVPATSLSILALAASQEQRFDIAENAYVVGQGRGWRDATIQRFASLTALRSGSADVAGYRLAALWKTGVEPATLASETAQILAVPAAADAYAQLMSKGGAGVPEFLTWAADNLAPETLDISLAGFRRAGYPFDCRSLSARARALVLQGRPAPAAALWNGTCGTPGEARDEPMDFAQPRGVPGPFDWIFPGAPGVDVAPISRDGAASLSFRNVDMLAHVVAQRTLALTPGHYSVRAKIEGTGEVRLRLTCGEKGGAHEKFVVLGKEPSPIDLPPGCTRQVVSLEVTTGSGVIEPIEID